MSKKKQILASIAPKSKSHGSNMLHFIKSLFLRPKENKTNQFSLEDFLDLSDIELIEKFKYGLLSSSMQMYILFELIQRLFAKTKIFSENEKILFHSHHELSKNIDYIKEKIKEGKIPQTRGPYKKRKKNLDDNKK
jgi:hypothetical protein